MKRPTARKLLGWSVGACLLCAGNAFPQSADALIDKLVEKGILTVKEANELREEADKNFSQAYAVKSGMPDYVTSLRLSGDVRVRYDGLHSDSDYDPAAGPDTGFVNRSRYRYRLRVGLTATLFENFEVGLRLTSSEPASGDSNYGGDPISGNSTFQNNGSKKFLYIDQAYGKWNFANGAVFSGSVTLGKMENPFVLDDMVFDPDYTPEGLGVQTGFKLSDSHSLRVNLGAFAIDEFSADSSDPNMLGAQLRWDATWAKKVSSTFGATFLSLQNSHLLTNRTTVPDSATGNTRLADGRLAYDFNPYVIDAAVTYSLDRFPLYKGAFPIKVAGEFMQNPAADSDADNYAWNAGIMFGKSGKRGTWDFAYTYKWLGANAWWEELVDSDYGAFYARTTTFPGAGANAGYSSGTNVKGHIVRLAYSPTDALLLAVKWLHTELIEESPTGSDSTMNRLIIDASLKF